METLFPPSYFPKMNVSMQENRSTSWTKEENKRFERALAVFDEKTPSRWQKIAEMIPGKSVSDVMRQYMELESDVSDIEAGKVQIPGYFSSSFTWEMVESCGFRGHLKGRSCDHERKKGVPWTEDEHRWFLMGLEKHGKGDWRNISRNFVKTKTPTQVASHAQKYFLRLNSMRKDRRRPSIHDITTVHLSENPVPLRGTQSQFSVSQSINDGTVTISDSIHGDSFPKYPFEIASRSIGDHFGSLNLLF